MEASSQSVAGALRTAPTPPHACLPAAAGLSSCPDSPVLVLLGRGSAPTSWAADGEEGSGVTCMAARDVLCRPHPRPRSAKSRCGRGARRRAAGGRRAMARTARRRRRRTRVRSLCQARQRRRRLRAVTAAALLALPVIDGKVLHTPRTSHATSITLPRFARLSCTDSTQPLLMLLQLVAAVSIHLALIPSDPSLCKEPRNPTVQSRAISNARCSDRETTQCAT